MHTIKIKPFTMNLMDKQLTDLKLLNVFFTINLFSSSCDGEFSTFYPKLHTHILHNISPLQA